MMGMPVSPCVQRYPPRIEAACEDFCGVSPHSMSCIMGETNGHAFMYRPGNSECDGMFESGRRSAVAPATVATQNIDFATMSERDVYANSSRSIRRNGNGAPPQTGAGGESDDERTREYAVLWNGRNTERAMV